MVDWINDLERLRALREGGHITDDEFDAAKAKVIGSGGAHTSASGEPQKPHEEPAYEGTPDTVNNPSKLDKASFVASQLTRISASLFLCGICLIVSIWAFGHLTDSPDEDVSLASDYSVPAAMLKQCAGAGPAANVQRFRGRTLGDFISNTAKLAPIKTKWESTGENQYTLTLIEEDKLAETSKTTKIAFKLIPGNGGATTCGPDTISFQRGVHEGREATESVLQMYVTALSLSPVRSSQNTSVDSGEATTDANMVALAAEAEEARGPVHLIAGSWVAKGQDCGGEEGMILDEGGIIRGESPGKWQFVNDYLTLTYNPKDVGNPSEFTGHLTWKDDDEFSAKWDDGQTNRWRRCPVNGVREPWSS